MGSSASDAHAATAVPVARELPDWVTNAALAAIVIGGIGTAIGLFVGRNQDMWWMLLVNFLFWGGIAQGMFTWGTILRTAQATWATGVNRMAMSAVTFLPFTIVLYLILMAGSEEWITWIHHPVPAKAVWLEETFFLMRNLVVLLVLGGLSGWYAYWYRGLSSRAGTENSEAAHGKLNKLAVAVVGAYVLGYTLLAFDLVMSLEPHWYSTLFGAYYFVGNLYASIAALIIYTALLYRHVGLHRYIGPKQFSDMGNLMLGFNILLSGFMFAQWLTIWYGNISEEIPYVMHRLYLFPWRGVGIALLVLIIFGPFLLLQSHALKQNPRRLIYVAAMVLVGMWLERWLLVVPAWSPDRLTGLGLTSWAIPVLCLGVLTLTVISNLRNNPEVCRLDEELKIT